MKEPMDFFGEGAEEELNDNNNLNNCENIVVIVLKYRCSLKCMITCYCSYVNNGRENEEYL